LQLHFELDKRKHLLQKGNTSSKYLTKKKPSNEGFNKKMAATYSPTVVVPSALKGLTSLFEMERGGTPSLQPP
tara:strand:+ start:4439 stop:4657 length:219 start_codon:yes stop_codon:yes gene_type:complete